MNHSMDGMQVLNLVHEAFTILTAYSVPAMACILSSPWDSTVGPIDSDSKSTPLPIHTGEGHDNLSSL
jgi:hypothetical protein